MACSCTRVSLSFLRSPTRHPSRKASRRRRPCARCPCPHTTRRRPRCPAAWSCTAPSAAWHSRPERAMPNGYLSPRPRFPVFFLSLSAQVLSSPFTFTESLASLCLALLQIASVDIPLVLTNSPCTNWTASRTWFVFLSWHSPPLLRFCFLHSALRLCFGPDSLPLATASRCLSVQARCFVCRSPQYLARKLQSVNGGRLDGVKRTRHPAKQFFYYHHSPMLAYPATLAEYKRRTFVKFNTSGLITRFCLSVCRFVGFCLLFRALFRLTLVSCLRFVSGMVP